MRRHAKAIVAISAFVVLTCALGAMSATAVAPVVSIDPASSVSYTSAHLSGKVNPEDQEPFYYFQYSADPKNEGWSSGSFQGPMPSGSGEAAVSDDIGGLKPGTEYFARLVATNFIEEWVTNPIVTFKTDPVFAPTASISAPSQVSDSSAHFEGQINPEGSNPAFNVRWHFHCTPACSDLEGDVPADTSAHTVEADATGLKPGTAYEVTLVATNDGAEAIAGPETFTTDTRAPEILSTSAGPLNDEATLKGQVDPGGLATTYHFEYGATAAYGLSTPERTIPATGDPVAVKAGVFGLTPGSGYHFKLVAENSEGSDESADRTFQTTVPFVSGSCANEAIRQGQNATYLPDCRAYERVSPAQKNGAGIKYHANGSGLYALSPDGDKAEYDAYTSLAGYGLTDWITSYEAVRTPSGWTSRPVSPPVEEDSMIFSGGMQLVDATPDLETFVQGGTGNFDPLDADKSPFGNSAIDLYTQRKGGPLTWASRGNADVPDTSIDSIFDYEVSDNGEHLVFQAEHPLVTPVGPSQEAGRNVYDRTNGVTHLVGVKTNGELTSVCGSVLPTRTGSSQSGTKYSSLRPVSDEGDTIAFISPDRWCEGDARPSSLYVRLNNATTVEISRPREGMPGPMGGPAFQAMSRDGGTVLFSSEDRLTASAPEAAGNKLYRWKRQGDTLEYLGVADLRMLFAASDDVSRFYFSSGDQLTPAAPEGASVYYYLYDRGTTRLVAAATAGTGGGIRAQANPSGDAVIITTENPLGAAGEGAGRDAYFYSPATGLTCLSCPPGGVSSASDVSLGSVTAVGGMAFRRNISADGRFAYFESPDRLAAADANNAIDVYQYDSQTGRVSLVGGGREGTTSRFATTSESGRDVLFGTTASLTPSDRDGDEGDLYDARIDGGFEAPSTPSLCAGEACQGEATPPAASAVPASAMVTGSGIHSRRKAKCRRTRAAKQARKPKCMRRSKHGTKHGKRQQARVTKGRVR